MQPGKAHQTPTQKKCVHFDRNLRAPPTATTPAQEIRPYIYIFQESLTTH